MVVRVGYTTDAELLSRLYYAMPCASAAAIAQSSSQSEQCTPEKHRRALGTTCVHTALPIQKSVKRRRAESVLAAQYTNDESSDAGAAQCKRQKLHSAEATTVAACTLASCRWGMGCLQPCPGKPIHC